MQIFVPTRGEMDVGVVYPCDGVGEDDICRAFFIQNQICSRRALSTACSKVICILVAAWLDSDANDSVLVGADNVIVDDDVVVIVEDYLLFIAIDYTHTQTEAWSKPLVVLVTSPVMSCC